MKQAPTRRVKIVLSQTALLVLMLSTFLEGMPFRRSDLPYENVDCHTPQTPLAVI